MMRRRLGKAVSVIQQALARFGPGMAIAHSGGKDAAAIMALFALVASLPPSGGAAVPYAGTVADLRAACAPPARPPAGIVAVLLPEADALPEAALTAALDCEARGVPLFRPPPPPHGGGGAAAFADFVRAQPQVAAVAVGARRGDPAARQYREIQRCTPPWPEAVWRVHPIMGWGVVDVFEFCLAAGATLCGLYAEGFGSLGSRSSTRPTSRLAGRPAWCLLGDGDEREGRSRL